MKVFDGLGNAPQTGFHEMLWKKKFAVYPSLKNTFFTEHL